MTDTPEIVVDTRGEQLENGWWRDALGNVGPLKPGAGARSNPIGWFPTGPDVGERLPTIEAPDHTGRMVDIEADRAGRPTAFVVYRSAVW